MSIKEDDEFWSSLRPATLRDIDAELRPHFRTSTPEEDYVDLLFWTMAQKGQREFAVRAPLTKLLLPDGSPVHVPELCAVITQLRRLSDIGEGRIIVRLEGGSFRITTTFNEGSNGPVCSILMEKEDS